ncbi:hypothetical protein [Yeosuana sp.]|uniref:hypothetical protein n=1 Tax=Yeosuana sp. TaxID=2529388 RepID=UPI0040497F56
MLDTLDNIFEQNEHQKDEDYGEYLYRTASLYRVNGKKDSANIYVQKAISFSEQHNYSSIAGVAYLIKAILNFNTDFEMSKYNCEKAMSARKFDVDTSFTAVAYGNLAGLHIRKNKLNDALKYTDSMMFLRRGINDHFARYFMYELRASIFEKLNNIDSAYVKTIKNITSYI